MDSAVYFCCVFPAGNGVDITLTLPSYYKDKDKCVICNTHYNYNLLILTSRPALH